MRTEVVIKYLGIILLVNAAMLFVAFLISVLLQETSTIPLLFSTLVCVILGIFPLIFVERVHDISFQEGLSIVVIGWTMTCIAGMLPYIMWGGEFSLVNAFFESVSGYTTTGSTILTDVEALPKGLLFWRASTHWLGGIGIVAFVLLILPKSRNPRLKLMNVEISEIARQNFRYTTRRVLGMLAGVYLLLTLAETLLLNLAGMGLFDSIAHSFATIATGGFSTRNLSVAYYDSLAIEIIIVVFMVLSGMHFGLLFTTFTGKPQNIFRSKVALSYVGAMAVGMLLVAANLYWLGYHSPGQALRTAMFQVASVGTTTGFATEDTAAWPSFSILILIWFTIQCAMAGSTSGGLKFDRVYLMVHSLRKQLRLLKHPNAVVTLRIDGQVIDESLERQTLVFILMYVLVFVTSTLLLTLLDVSLLTAFSASIACLGNVGPGFEHVSSMGNFSELPAAGKFVLSIVMLLGRLEIFSVLGFLSTLRGR
ncbi:MAG TPA: potassium transporter TrkG [Bacteroidales bacterium]|nr:potassium transporter TrkG [Bacteroidales bacterium]